MTDDLAIADRRVRRTRRALISAFNRLVMEKRLDDIKVADIIAAADVGRSTFYEHYSGRRDIHVDAMATPMAVLADAATGRGDEEALTGLLEHFWDNRALARATLQGDNARAAIRLLADQITERLNEKPGAGTLPVRLAAMQMAQGHLGLVLAWVTGEASAKPAQLAPVIMQSSEAAVRALFAVEAD
ncbi:hypothetical protein [Maricaulis sp.]|uniref:hypothetical protein n=1 Tax=Maricaulis sp. TaxID=1486257 RepID=UPI00262763F4|nr:hypothetical protein [Maricaulis sp.]